MSEIQVAEDDDGRRVDRILRYGFPNVPPGAIAGAIRRGEVRLNLRKTTGSARAAAGDRLTVPDWDDTGHERRRAAGGRGTRESHARGRDGRLEIRARVEKNAVKTDRYTIPILDRTEDWLALNKPAGIPAHGAGALDEIVRTVASDEGWWRESVSFRPGPIHRLDTGTSGVQLFSLSAHGAQTFTEELRRRRVTKLYFALVSGAAPARFRIEHRLAYDRSRRLAVAEPNGARAARLRFSSARTDLYPIAETADRRASLVAAVPLTGRTHQIRVHLAAEGLPLIGDAHYGGPRWSEVFPEPDRDAPRERYLLHAMVLAFEKPRVMWNAPLQPGDFSAIRSAFGDPSGIKRRLTEILQLACTGCDRKTTIAL